MAGGDHSLGRHPGIAGRHFLPDGGVRIHAQQFVAVRPGAGDRHRGRRRHRRRRKCRAQYRDRPCPSRGGQEKHDRGRLGTDRHCARAVRRVRAVSVHHRHLGPVLPAIRAHHRRRHHYFADRVADLVAGDVRALPQAPRSQAPRPLVGGADPSLLRRLQLEFRQGRRRAFPGLPAARCAAPPSCSRSI